MPVCKKRPHIIELLNIAVEQKSKLNESITEILERPVSIWFQRVETVDAIERPELNQDGSNRTLSEKSTPQKSGHAVSWISGNDVFKFLFSVEMYQRCIAYSRSCEKFLLHPFVNNLRKLGWPLAFTVMVYEASLKDYSMNSTQDHVLLYLDWLLNAWFLLDCYCRLGGVLIRIKIENAFNREINYSTVVLHSGLLDAIVTGFCIGYGISEVGLWFRLARLILIVSTVTELFPHLEVLLSGISNGLRSIFYTVVVFFLIIFFYAALGFHLFKENDPLRFGTYALSFITFFQLSTFENWSVVYDVNANGCNALPSEYDGTFSVPNNETIVTQFGAFAVPECTAPSGNPYAASFVFISYALIEGYVIVSMCLAAVAIGINERLESLRNVEVYGDQERSVTLSHVDLPGGKRHARLPHEEEADNGKASKLLGGKSESKEIAAMLKKIWESNDAILVGVDGISHGDSSKWLDPAAWASFYTRIVKSNYFFLLKLVWILGEAVLQLIEYNNPRQSLTLLPVHIMFQVGFTLANLCGVASYFETPRAILKNYWLLFSVFITLWLFVPLVAYNEANLQIICSLRLLRLISLLEAMSWLHDLKIILDAISNSFLALFYVAVLIFAFFLYFGVAGMLLLRRSIPMYFISLPASLKTLLQVMTLDNWSDIMRKGMYGCKQYGYATGNAVYDAGCLNGYGFGTGYWSPIFFFCFIILASMVLSSLLVGVIISSMELLREGYVEEALIWRQVKVVSRRYHIASTQVNLMFRLFEKMDKNCNGRLNFGELAPILNFIQMNPTEQFQFFRQVDTDQSGQIDFSEFCEMISLIGLAKKIQASQPLGSAHQSTAEAVREGTLRLQHPGGSASPNLHSMKISANSSHNSSHQSSNNNNNGSSPFIMTPVDYENAKLSSRKANLDFSNRSDASSRLPRPHKAAVVHITPSGNKVAPAPDDSQNSNNNFSDSNSNVSSSSNNASTRINGRTIKQPIMSQLFPSNMPKLDSFLGRFDRNQNSGLSNNNSSSSSNNRSGNNSPSKFPNSSNGVAFRVLQLENNGEMDGESKQQSTQKTDTQITSVTPTTNTNAFSVLPFVHPGHLSTRETSESTKSSSNNNNNNNNIGNRRDQTENENDDSYNGDHVLDNLTGVGGYGNIMVPIPVRRSSRPAFEPLTTNTEPSRNDVTIELFEQMMEDF